MVDLRLKIHYLFIGKLSCYGMKKSTILIVVAVVLIAFLVWRMGGSVERMDPISLPDAFLGPEDSAIVVVEYSDFECPYCGASAGANDVVIQRLKSQNPFWEPAGPGLIDLAEQGEIKYIFKPFPVLTPMSFSAAEAVKAAQAQGMFWEYKAVVFENQGRLSQARLIQFAEDLGLDMEQFNQEFKGRAYEADVREDLAAGQRAGVSGTPAFTINGRLYSGAQPFSTLESEINALKEQMGIEE